MTDTLKAFLERLAREPVLLFGAVGLSITAWAPSLVDTDPEKAAVAAILLFLQRAFSTSKRTVEETVDQARSAARDGALADVASLKAPAKPRSATKRTRKTP